MKAVIKSLLLFTFIFHFSNASMAQINEDKVGAWYMYFVNKNFKNSQWGFQGDLQYRNWNLGGDLEQLLVRGGLTFRPSNSSIKLTLGYGSITTGVYGDDESTTHESRLYQEALLPAKISDRFLTSHRFRYEQRFLNGQDLRTRFRYNLFLNILLNKKEMSNGALYLALYNEVFINGERNIGNGATVELFDRNRFYSALGYMVSSNTKIQVGLMNQTTENWKKNQLQISLHQSF